MMRIVIRCQGCFVDNMVRRVGIGVCLRMAFMVLDLPYFVRTRHDVSETPLEVNYISPNYKKCRFPAGGWEIPHSGRGGAMREEGRAGFRMPGLTTREKPAGEDPKGSLNFGLTLEGISPEKGESPEYEVPSAAKVRTIWADSSGYWYAPRVRLSGTPQAMTGGAHPVKNPPHISLAAAIPLFQTILNVMTGKMKREDS